MDQVVLEGLEFFAYHGFYKAERKIGNKYGIDICLSTNLELAAQADKLKDTIDYEKLYKLIDEEVKKPSKLLENIALRITNAVFRRFAQVQKVKIVVKKYNPPIGGVCSWACVKLKRRRQG